MEFAYPICIDLCTLMNNLNYTDCITVHLQQLRVDRSNWYYMNCYIWCLVWIVPWLYVLFRIKYIEANPTSYQRIPSFKTMLDSSLPPVVCRMSYFLSYLRYVCLFPYSGVQHTLWCAFCLVCLRLVSYVPKVVSFSGLSIPDCLFGFL